MLNQTREKQREDIIQQVNLYDLRQIEDNKKFAKESRLEKEKRQKEYKDSLDLQGGSSLRKINNGMSSMINEDLFLANPCNITSKSRFSQKN